MRHARSSTISLPVDLQCHFVLKLLEAAPSAVLLIASTCCDGKPYQSIHSSALDLAKFPAFPACFSDPDKVIELLLGHSKTTSEIPELQTC